MFKKYILILLFLLNCGTEQPFLQKCTIPPITFETFKPTIFKFQYCTCLQKHDISACGETYIIGGCKKDNSLIVIKHYYYDEVTVYAFRRNEIEFYFKKTKKENCGDIFDCDFFFQEARCELP